jgi:hypothetical protein
VDLVLEDKNGFAHDAYNVGDEWGVAVVRPDGVVGAVARGPHGLHHYFSNLLQDRPSLRR